MSWKHARIASRRNGNTVNMKSLWCVKKFSSITFQDVSKVFPIEEMDEHTEEVQMELTKEKVRQNI